MDLKITETGNGGDIGLLGSDLAVVQGLENMPYLAMFGGDAWWGNELLLADKQDMQFLSQTEKALLSVALNSAGRITIENAIKADLQFLLENVPGTQLALVTKITSDNKIESRISFAGQNFSFMWNPENKQLTTA